MYNYFAWSNNPWQARTPFVIEASRSHSDTSHSAGLLWRSDQTDAETYTWQYTTLTTDRFPCLRRDSKPTVSAGERPQTYALDRAATGTGVIYTTSGKLMTRLVIKHLRIVVLHCVIFALVRLMFSFTLKSTHKLHVSKDSFQEKRQE